MEFKPKKEYIAKLLNDEDRKFIIPEYQRPYKWDQSQCETLWNDICEVFGRRNEEYFLGSIIAHSEDDQHFEIIDGQQRITTFTLLFRAFYECFKSENENAQGDYPREFGKCIWEYENDKGLCFDKEHLSSKVATEKEKENLKRILSKTIRAEENTTSKNNQSNYFKNYDYFYRQLREFKKKHAMEWKDLCDFVLKKRLFILFIVCDSQDSAMTIFNTLNSRGLPLSNADIFKGHLYKYYKQKNEEEIFIAQWKSIEETIENSNTKDSNLDFLFLQYMHVIRAIKNDSDTRKSGLLEFFTKESTNSKYKHYGYTDKWLYQKETMPFITHLAHFWLHPEDYLSNLALRYMSVLSLFQNAGWKSFVSCLLWKYQDNLNENFEKETFSKELEPYLLGLLKAISLLLLNLNASTNSTDQLIFKLNAKLLNSQDPFNEIPKFPSQESFLENFCDTDSKKVKYVLLLNAYIDENFKVLIEPSKLEVEHILPKSWQNANFNGWNEKLHEEYLDQIGNKILLTKKINIKCADNFFAKKQIEYKKSALKEVHALGNREKRTWQKEDIEARNEEIYKRLEQFFAKS